MFENKQIDINNKIQAIKNYKFTRYFTKHKGKFKIIFILLVIIIICFIFHIPINGDYPETESLDKEIIYLPYEFKKVIGFIGFISNMLIVTLFISISGVETYFSREELANARKETEELGFQKIDEKIQNINKFDYDKKLKLQNIANKIRSISSLLKNEKIYISNKVVAFEAPIDVTPAKEDDYKIKGKNDNYHSIVISKDPKNIKNLKDIKDSDIKEYLDIIKFAFMYDKSLDEVFLLEIINELDKI